MKLATGYFGNLRLYRKNNLTPLAICQYAPQWYNGSVETRLAPPKWLLQKIKSGTIDYETQFVSEYKRHLEALGEEKIKKILATHGANLVLLCYEKNYNECHRKILADYLRERGVEIGEYSEPSVAPVKAVLSQGLLF